MTCVSGALLEVFRVLHKKVEYLEQVRLLDGLMDRVGYAWR